MSSIERIIISEPIQVEQRLRELQSTLSGELLLSALEAGMADQARTTENHPATYRGSVMYGESTCRLRELGLPLGWIRESTKNFETLVAPDGRMAIVVASGDEWTGTASVARQPTTRHGKGLVTRRVVYRNRQAALEFVNSAEQTNAEVFAPDDDGQDKYQLTWFLLHCLVDGELRSELSHPTKIDEAGKITAWSERLILGRIPGSPEVMPRPEDEPVEPIVEVRRRGN